MFRAIEQAQRHRFPDSEDGSAYARFIENTIEHSYPFVSREVREALGRVNRFDYILPCLAEVDKRYDFSPEDIAEETMWALQGEPALIWIQGKEWIRSTDIKVSARMIDAGLTPHRNRACIAGCGSGFTAALIENTGFRKIYAVERIEELASISQKTLIEKGIANVKVISGNAVSWVEGKGFFDTILVFAAISNATVTNTFFSHLHEGGALVAPIGKPDNCHLYQFVRNSRAPSGFVQRLLEHVQFTPFVT